MSRSGVSSSATRDDTEVDLVASHVAAPTSNASLHNGPSRLVSGETVALELQRIQSSSAIMMGGSNDGDGDVDGDDENPDTSLDHNQGSSPSLAVARRVTISRYSIQGKYSPPSTILWISDASNRNLNFFFGFHMH